jgi:HK97 family phage portal protein
MWSRIVRLLAGPPSSARPRASTFSIDDPLFMQFLGALHSIAGVTVTERTVLGLSAFWRAVSLIAGTIAGLPLRTMRDQIDRDSGEAIRTRIASWVDDPAGPDSYTSFEWAEIVVLHLVIQGNAYLVHRYNAMGALVGATPVHPLCVDVAWADVHEGRPVVGGKLYTITLPADRFGGARVLRLDGSKVTQIMGPTLDGLKGMSLLTVARTSLGASIAADDSAARMFAQGPLISGMVTPEEDVEPDEAEKIKNDLNARITGSENSGTIAVINRRLKFTPWTMSLEDAQFLGSRAFQIEEIARWTGVPPHLLMQTEKQTSWGTGVSEQNRGLRQFNLVGWTSRIEQRLTRLTPRTQFVEFDFAGLERGSASDEIELLLKETDGGLLTINEARRVRNLPPLPGGDVLRIRGMPLDGDGPAQIEPVPAGANARAWADAMRARDVARARETIHVRSERLAPAQITSGGNR